MGITYENIKFKAEAVRTLAFATGTPCGWLIMQSILTKTSFGEFFTLKGAIAVISIVSFTALLHTSYNIMDEREEELKRLFKNKEQLND